MEEIERKEVSHMTIRSLVPGSRRRTALMRAEDNPSCALRREMDDLVEGFFRGFDAEPFEGKFSPAIDVAESDREITVRAEVAGIDKKDIDVSVTRDALTITGEKKEDREDKGEGYWHSERAYGSFSRTIPLRKEVDRDKISASYRNSVLTVTLPKTGAAAEEGRRVSIKTG
jgi:HSP20 family protein